MRGILHLPIKGKIVVGDHQCTLRNVPLIRQGHQIINWTGRIRNLMFYNLFIQPLTFIQYFFSSSLLCFLEIAWYTGICPNNSIRKRWHIDWNADVKIISSVQEFQMIWKFQGTLNSMFMDCEQANKYTHHAALLTRMLNFLPNRTFQFTMLITTSDSYLYKYCIWWNASLVRCSVKKGFVMK